MKRALIVATSVVSLFVGTAAFAVDTVGTIKTIDAKKHEVTLDNGQSYHFRKDPGLSEMKTGEKVKIIYEMKAGKNEATEISPAT